MAEREETINTLAEILGTRNLVEAAQMGAAPFARLFPDGLKRTLVMAVSPEGASAREIVEKLGEDNVLLALPELSDIIEQSRKHRETHASASLLNTSQALSLLILKKADSGMVGNLPEPFNTLSLIGVREN